MIFAHKNTHPVVSIPVSSGDREPGADRREGKVQGYGLRDVRQRGACVCACVGNLGGCDAPVIVGFVSLGARRGREHTVALSVTPFALRVCWMRGLNVLRDLTGNGTSWPKNRTKTYQRTVENQNPAVIL